MLYNIVDRSVTRLNVTGSEYEYRGADIRVDAGGSTFSFTLAGYPLLGWAGLNSLETAMKLVDSWLDRSVGA